MGEAVTRVQSCLLFAVLFLGVAVAPAHAQWLATPYLGVNVAGDTEFRRGGPGVSFGNWQARFGFEFDVMRYNHFFKDVDVVPRDPAAPPNCTAQQQGPCADINTDAIGFMGNVVVPFRGGAAAKWQPYGTAGLGLIRAWTNEQGRHQNDLGFNAGGGVTYWLKGRLGLRGDLRYTRALVEKTGPANNRIRATDYGYWRTAFGVTFAVAGK
jgi:hypothetical protein